MRGQPNIQQPSRTLTDQALEEIIVIENSPKQIAGIGTFWATVRSMGFNYAFAMWCWQEEAIDTLVLAPPNHHGTTQELAREVYHRLVMRFASEKVMMRQRWTCLCLCLVVPVAFSFIWSSIGRALDSPFRRAIAEFISHVPIDNPFVAQWDFFLMGIWVFALGLAIGLAIGFAIAFVTFMLIPHIMRGVITDEIRIECAAIVRRCFLRGIPEGTPDDLADVWRHGWVTAESAPITSELTDTDASSTAALKSAELYRWMLMAVVFYMPLAMGFVLIIGIIPEAMWAMKMIRSLMTNDLAQRKSEMEMQRSVEGSLFIAAGGQAWAKLQERARVEQMNLARKDKAPLVTLGTTTGILAARGDLFAPSEGLKFQLSLTDLQNHVIVFGGTGSGKTSGILRPLAQQVARWKNVGIVVMDGKGSLPRELEALPGMQVIDPATTVLSLVRGLSPNEVIDAIVELLGRGGTDRFWNDSAAGLLRRAAVMTHAAGGMHWTLSNINRAIIQSDYRRELLQVIPREAVLSSPELVEAINFFEHEWKVVDTADKGAELDRTRSSILTIAKTWMSTIMGHPDLLRWGQTSDEQETVDLYTPLEGGRIGFLIPAYRYGRAGAVVTALLKARLYAKLKARADRKWALTESPVVFLIDEAQEVATDEDATMLAIGRSLGLAMIGATQTIEGVREKLGEATASKWLAIYGGMVALPGRSPLTDGFAAGRMGLTWSASVQHRPGAPIRETMQRDVLMGISATSRYQTLMAQGKPVDRQSHGVSAAIMSQQRGSVFEPTSDIGPHALMNGGELLTLLARPDTALIVTTRARVPRRDVVQLSPVYEIQPTE